MSDIIFTVEKEDPEQDIFKLVMPKNDFGISELGTILSIITGKKCDVKVVHNENKIKCEIRKEK